MYYLCTYIYVHALLSFILHRIFNFNGVLTNMYVRFSERHRQITRSVSGRLSLRPFQQLAAQRLITSFGALVLFKVCQERRLRVRVVRISIRKQARAKGWFRWRYCTYP